MAVYVDRLRSWGWKMRGREVDSCHLLTDGPLEELHALAERIGMKRAWFQGKRIPHYDLTPSRRAAAVQAGAIEVTDQELVALLRRIRDTLCSSPPKN